MSGVRSFRTRFFFVSHGQFDIPPWGYYTGGSVSLFYS